MTAADRPLLIHVYFYKQKKKREKLFSHYF